MSPCPSCRSEPLVELAARPGVTVELCQRCKGILADERALAGLASSSDLTAHAEPRGPRSGLASCLRCNTENWQAQSLGGEGGAAFTTCHTCGMFWFEAGELERLERQLLAARRRARRLATSDSSSGPHATCAQQSPTWRLGMARLAGLVRPHAELAARALERPPPAPEPFGRISFEHGIGNLLGAPLSLAFALVCCSTTGGRILASLVSMPFHELGHALASWLGSRFAVPLPFFTVWSSEQSAWVGLVVAGSLGALGFHSFRERRRFGVAMALVLLGVQIGLSWFVAPRSSLMLQILAGALGELLLSALLLVGFHFPLPDRLRWDFWRWPALAPGALCFAQAVWMWVRAADDVRHIPWGSAIGAESDGDMNRLVRDFGWTAADLPPFYLTVAALAVVGLGGTYAWAIWRYRSRPQGSA